MKRRILSIITALALCLSLCPTWAFATEADPSLCKHHPEHTEDCGYAAPTEGHGCGHQHTAECYTKGVLPDADGGDYYEIGADTENLLDCQHSHDSDCGYVQADPGAPCGYVCRICPIEALIAALPEQVSEDNADDVRAQLDHILDLFTALNEDEQEEINLSRIYALQGALDAANVPDMIEGEVSVTYQEASWNGGVTYTTQTADSCTPVADSAEAVTWDAGWYVVNSTVTIDQPITVTGAVNLILADGCTLNAEKGIVVTTDNSLTIYAQSGGTGTLNATGTTDSSNNASAGIGGSTTSFDSGVITIHGGVINATGGGQSGYCGGAGIGGGTPNSGNGGSSGAITIYGGTVTANSGEGGLTGAGIGGGGGEEGGTSSNITIYGGSVTAASIDTGTGGAGIGGGSGFTGGGGDSNIQIHGGAVNATGGYLGAGIGGGADGAGTSGNGTVTISGGTVTAIGGKYAAGIGGGGYSAQYISCTGGAGSVTITGGIVDAKGGAGNSSGDYAGAPIGNGGNTGDTAATVSKTNAIVFENGAGTVCGDVTFDGSYTLPVDYTLNIPVGASLSGSGTLSGGSAFTTENLTEDMISVPTNLYYNGEDRTEYLTTELSGELTKGVTICGQTFTVSGWTLAVEKAADSDLTYTATYTNDSDNTKTVQKTITLLQSGTKFEGGIKTYNGETETTSFTAGDTITVKATPTPTGDAPQKAAARLRADPTEGQMVVYVGTTQVSVPADKGEDGTYTMEVSAADVLLAAGGPGTGITLTAKFVGNDNMADGAGTVKVNITAVAKAERGGNVIDYFGVSDFEGTNNLFCQEAYADATITLLGDVQPGTNSDAGTTCSTMVNITCTLDLAGHNFTSTDTAIYVLPMGNLTIQDSSTGKTGNVSFIKSDGTLTLYGGTFGKIETAYTLSSLLAENCAYYRGSTPILLSELEGQKTLDGTVTVQECQHTGVEATNNGDGTHSVNCPYCGFENAAEPHSFNETGYCPACRLQAAAKVEKDGSDTVYVEASGLADVFKDSGNAGATVTLLSDVALSQTVTISGGQFTLSGNGHTITYTGDGAAIQIASGTVTLSDCKIDGKQCGVGVSDGTVKLSGCTITAAGDENGGGQGVYISGGDVTISGGTYSGKGGYAACGVEIQSGKLTIESGTFSGADGDRACGVNVGQNGKATIRDGSFSGTGGYDASGLRVLFGGNAVISGGVFTGSYYGVYNTGTTTISGGTFTGDTNPLYSNASLAGMLATGCAYYRDDKPIEVDNGLSPGTVTVQECQHTGVEVTDLGNGKHGLDCPYCGYHSEHTTALTATASGNAVTLSEGCATCEYKKELGTVGFTFENLVYGNPDAKVTFTNIPANYILMCQDNQRDDGMTEVSWTLAELFNSTKVTAGKHNMKVSFVNAANIYSNECELPFTVAKAPLMAVIDATNGSVTKPYDGTTAAPEGLAITLTGLVEGDDVTASASFAYNSENVADANTITATDITLGGKDAGNYTLDPKSASISGTITKAEQAPPSAPSASVENIKDTSITLNTIANAEYSKDGDTWQASPTFTGLDPNRAYTFYARLKEDGNHNASPSSTASITTRKMMLDNATVTVGGSYTYTGAAQTPTVAVVKNGKTLTAGTDYTVSYANNTNAGTATVTITGMGDYEGTNSTTFTIQRKTLTVAGAIAAGRPYNGTNTVTITGVTLDGVVNGDTVSVSTADLTGTLNGSNVGSYTAVTLPALTLTGEKADNYTLTRPAGAVSTSVTISKAAARTPKTGDLAVANKQAHTYTFGLGALRPDLPAGMSFGSGAVTYELGAVSLGSYYGGSGAKIEGQTLTLPIQAVESNEAEGIGTITVTIKSDNFEDITATINVRSVNKTIPTGAPTLSAATLTYGQPLSTITLRGDMAAGATPVPGKFEWSSPDNRPAVQEAYAAAWVFTPTDNNTYAIVNGTSTIKVVPASVAGAVVTLSPTSFRYDGQSHSPTVTSVKLGDTTLTADTDYTVEIPTETAAGTYTVTITGKGNYTGTAAATFTINPVETGDEFEDESGTTLRLEVETGLSTVPEALKNNAKYDTPAKIEAELRTRVEQVMSNVGGNIAVFDVTLQYKDESGAWHNVDLDHFPTEGVTAILPYPDGTGATGYTFTVQHLISSGAQAGTMETLSYTLTADGLQCKFLTLSPVAIGYQAAAKPVDPVNPNPGGGSGGGGGGWSSSTYAVTVERAEHGKVTSNRTNASSGSTVTLTVTPDTGYVLDTLTVTDSRGNAIKLTAQGNGKYTFTMPGRAVTVKAAFAPLPDDTACDGGEGCPSRGFTDLGSVGTWYHEAVDYVLRNNLMGGYGNGLFGPNDTLTRAQFAQILYNKEGRPTVTGDGIFTDVAPGVWCAPAITWAAERGIVGGYGNGMFGPNDNITREQLAVMLWRYAGSPAATDKELHFNDAGKASGYALDALRWAVENGIINGKGGGILDPKGLATRAQTAQMLKNFLGK